MKDNKFIVWDWNGTLLDDTDIVLDCINVALSKIDFPAISMEVLRKTQSTPFEALYRALGVPREKVDILVQKNHVFHDSYERRADYAPLREGAASLLKRLQINNVSNLILSNHIADQIVRLMKKHDIHRFFDKVMAFDSPDSQFCDITKGERLRRHIATEKLNSSNAVIVGDTREEIKIAHDLGMSSVAITGGILSESLLRDERPDYIVHSFDDLSSLMHDRGFVT